MSALLFSVIGLILNYLVPAYIWIILAYCIASMAVGFGVIDIRNNRFLMAAFSTLVNLVEPVLRPIRSVLPDLGALDLAPLILLLLVEYGVPYILRWVARMIFVAQGM